MPQTSLATGANLDLRILISQRVDAIEGRNEVRDALDQAWQDTLARLTRRTVEMLPVPNRCPDPGALARSLAADLIVLSGGNDIGQAADRDRVERALLQHARETRLPTLGVCRGMQMMQVECGGALKRVGHHVARDHIVEALSDSNCPATLSVNSFHNFAIEQNALSDEFNALYRHSDGTIEAMSHVDLPWLGVMWHPERPHAESADAWLAEWLRRTRQ